MALFAPPVVLATEPFPTADRIITGPGAGEAGPEVRIFEVQYESYGKQVGSFFAYGPSFRGGVNVAGLGVGRIVTGPGSGGGPHVRFFDVSSPSSPTFLGGFFAYPPDFRDGVSPSAGDIDGDGSVELVTAPGMGGPPWVRVFDVTVPSEPSEIASFFAYGETFRGAVNTAVGDVDGDGRAEVITGPVGAGGPHVRVFDLAEPESPRVLGQFFAYARDFRGGVNVAAGDVDGDKDDEVITAPATAGAPHVRIFDWDPATRSFEETAGFLAQPPGTRSGLHVATAEADGDGKDEVVVGPGWGHRPLVRIFDIEGGSASLMRAILAYPESRDDGVFVGAVK